MLVLYLEGTVPGWEDWWKGVWGRNQWLQSQKAHYRMGHSSRHALKETLLGAWMIRGIFGLGSEGILSTHIRGREEGEFIHSPPPSLPLHCSSWGHRKSTLWTSRSTTQPLEHSISLAPRSAEEWYSLAPPLASGSSSAIRRCGSRASGRGPGGRLAPRVWWEMDGMSDTRSENPLFPQKNFAGGDTLTLL